MLRPKCALSAKFAWLLYFVLVSLIRQLKLYAKCVYMLSASSSKGCLHHVLWYRHLGNTAEPCGVNAQPDRDDKDMYVCLNLKYAT